MPRSRRSKRKGGPVIRTPGAEHALKVLVLQSGIDDPIALTYPEEITGQEASDLAEGVLRRLQEVLGSYEQEDVVRAMRQVGLGTFEITVYGPVWDKIKQGVT